MRILFLFLVAGAVGVVADPRAPICVQELDNGSMQVDGTVCSLKGCQPAGVGGFVDPQVKAAMAKLLSINGKIEKHICVQTEYAAPKPISTDGGVIDAGSIAVPTGRFLVFTGTGSPTYPAVISTMAGSSLVILQKALEKNL